METIKSVCRICLECNGAINWNDEIKDLGGISYKNCYYKYTQLKETDADCYSTSLCDSCAAELKNAHIFFGHALESFKILQNTFKEKEHATDKFLLKNCPNSPVITCDTFDGSFIDGKEHYDIDEVICYSPVSDDVGTENDLYEIIYDPSSTSPLQTAIEQQPVDNYAKVRNSFSESKEAASLPKKHISAFETKLELNLQLEIHGTNLLKSTNKEGIKSSHQRLIKKQSKGFSKNSVPQQAVQCSVSFERVQDANQQLSNSEGLLSNTESPGNDNVNAFEDPTNDCLDQSILEKPKESRKSSIVKSSGRKRGSELAEYLLFIKNLKGSDINFPDFSATHLKSNRLQKLSISEQNEKPSEQSVNPLSEERFGKECGKDNLSICKPQKQKEIMCQYCSKVFISIYKAIEHEKTHLENRERKETCTKCGLKFYNKNALRSHMYTHKENREKNLKCEFCGKAFYNNNGLSIHRRIHVGPRMPCSICSKEYYRQSDLDKHMVSHSVTRVDGDLKYRKKYFVYCEICGNEVRSVDYKSHIAKHNNEPLAKCAICNKEFFSRKSCISHLKSVHQKGSGERSTFAISYKTKYYSKLFLEQKTGALFTKEKV